MQQESPPKLDVEGVNISDKKKSDTLRKLFSRREENGGGGGKGGKGAKGGKGKAAGIIIIESETMEHKLSSSERYHNSSPLRFSDSQQRVDMLSAATTPNGGLSEMSTNTTVNIRKAAVQQSDINNSESNISCNNITNNNSNNITNNNDSMSRTSIMDNANIRTLPSSADMSVTNIQPPSSVSHMISKQQSCLISRQSVKVSIPLDVLTPLQRFQLLKPDVKTPNPVLPADTRQQSQIIDDRSHNSNNRFMPFSN